jgi:hypothetical protein
MSAETKICECCGTAYARPRDYSEAQWTQRRFCSRKCFGRFPKPLVDLREKFEENYIPEPMSGCWIWTGYMSGYGYGQIRLNGETYLSNRLSHILLKGPIPSGLSVLHHCDNRLCVNPDHLYAGTPADNVRDMRVRGRIVRGERHHQSKLTATAVIEIRSSDETDTALARRYGVSRPSVRRAREGLTWGHV